jgi:hypothetical protein
VFGLFKKKIAYETFGYEYADSLLPTLIGIADTTDEWTGKQMDAERLGKELGVLVLAILQASFMNMPMERKADARILAGFIRRFSIRYRNFALSDVQVTFIKYLDAALADFMSETEDFGFRKLVPLAITEITGLMKENEYWSLAEKVLKTFTNKVFLDSYNTLTTLREEVKLV